MLMSSLFVHAGSMMDKVKSQVENNLETKFGSGWYARSYVTDSGKCTSICEGEIMSHGDLCVIGSFSLEKSGGGFLKNLVKKTGQFCARVKQVLDDITINRFCVLPNRDALEELAGESEHGWYCSDY